MSKSWFGTRTFPVQPMPLTTLFSLSPPPQIYVLYLFVFFSHFLFTPHFCHLFNFFSSLSPTWHEKTKPTEYTLTYPLLVFQLSTSGSMPQYFSFPHTDLWQVSLPSNNREARSLWDAVTVTGKEAGQFSMHNSKLGPGIRYSGALNTPERSLAARLWSEICS